MKTFLITASVLFLIACGADPDRNEPNSSSSWNSSSPSGQETKSYTVTTNAGQVCNVMMRHSNNTYSSNHDYTLQCPAGTKIGCMRGYDESGFILCTESSYVGAYSYGLIAADGYGNGTVNCSDFGAIASVSLHETSCN